MPRWIVLALALVIPRSAWAQPDDDTPAKQRARYSLPWSLRPAVAPNIVRVDTAIALQDAATTYVPVLTIGYKPFASVPDLGFYARGGVVHHTPDREANAVALTNPVASVLFTPEIAPHWRLALFAGVSLPLGSGGGADPEPATRRAILAGIYARQGMDGTLMLTNYATPTGGLALAWINHGVTLQAEATIFQFMRVRGVAIDPDAIRTTSTFGLHVGYRVASALTISLEAHHQRFLSTPTVVRLDSDVREQTTAGGGLRLNLPLSRNVIARPGVAYFHPLDDPMAASGHRVVIVDIPVAF